MFEGPGLDDDDVKPKNAAIKAKTAGTKKFKVDQQDNEDKWL